MGANNYDALPAAPNILTDCTINNVNPKTESGRARLPAPTTLPSGVTPNKADGDDKASDLAAAPGASQVQYPTTVTVYACFNWNPPMAGSITHSEPRSRSVPWSPNPYSVSGKVSAMKPRDRQSGQILVIFAGGFVTLLVIAALVIELGSPS